jgi:hypothetical protein
MIKRPKTDPFKSSSAPAATGLKDLKDLKIKEKPKSHLSSSIKSSGKSSVLYSELLEDLTEVSKLADSCTEMKKYTMAAALFVWISKFASRHASVDSYENNPFSDTFSDPFKEKRDIWINKVEKNIILAQKTEEEQPVDFRNFVYKAGLDAFVRAELLVFMNKEKEWLPSAHFGDWPNPPTFVGMYEGGCKVLRILLEDPELAEDRGRICDYLARANVAFTQRRE